MKKEKIGKCVKCGKSILLDTKMNSDFNSLCFDCLLDVDLKDVKKDFNSLTDFTEGSIFIGDLNERYDCSKGTKKSMTPLKSKKVESDEDEIEEEKEEKKDMDDIDEIKKRDLNPEHGKVETIKFTNITKHSEKEQPKKVYGKKIWQ